MKKVNKRTRPAVNKFDNRATDAQPYAPTRDNRVYGPLKPGYYMYCPDFDDIMLRIVMPDGSVQGLSVFNGDWITICSWSEFPTYHPDMIYLEGL